ncbi:MAG: hypothetical protein A3K59_08840 [Euryarchaeota archaeon RBG_19FT_COMBO_69_17]|nr:MAG: hypothetical protein A3K59_08840 [Euryarchaeota archaeon RBG_19FT_COMBO_69_17]
MPHGGHKFDPAHRAHLDAPERREYLDPERILDAFAVGPGLRLADVGAGTGFFALPAARRVGRSGRVYAIDLTEAMLEELRSRAPTAAGNLEVVPSTEDRIPLPDRSVDVAFLACVLHELDGPGTLRECARILAPGGRLAIVDWVKKDQDIGPPREHRLSESEAAAVLGAAGFRVARTFPAGPHHYGIEARPAPRRT